MLLQPPKFIQPEPKKGKMGIYFVIGVVLLAIVAVWYVKTYGESPVPPAEPAAITEPEPAPPAPPAVTPTPLGDPASGDAPLATPPPKK